MTHGEFCTFSANGFAGLAVEDWKTWKNGQALSNDRFSAVEHLVQKEAEFCNYVLDCERLYDKNEMEVAKYNEALRYVRGFESCFLKDVPVDSVIAVQVINMAEWIRMNLKLPAPFPAFVRETADGHVQRAWV